MQTLNNFDTDKILQLYNMLADERAISAKVASATWDFAVDGGAIGSIGSGVKIPNGSVITKAWVDVLTTCTSATDAGTMAITVASAGDIVAAAEIKAVANPWDAGIHAAIPVGSAATMIKLTAEKEITFTLAVEAFTAGKVRVFVEYIASPVQ